MAQPNPMPESVRDRCTKSHEYIFLFSKNRKYYYDNEAIKEPVKQDWGTRNRTTESTTKKEQDWQPHSGLTKAIQQKINDLSDSNYKTIQRCTLCCVST